MYPSGSQPERLGQAFDWALGAIRDVALRTCTNFPRHSDINYAFDRIFSDGLEGVSCRCRGVTRSLVRCPTEQCFPGCACRVRHGPYIQNI